VSESLMYRCKALLFREDEAAFLGAPRTLTTKVYRVSESLIYRRKALLFSKDEAAFLGAQKARKAKASECQKV